jgi:hypothetical protein
MIWTGLLDEIYDLRFKALIIRGLQLFLRLQHLLHCDIFYGFDNEFTTTDAETLVEEFKVGTPCKSNIVTLSTDATQMHYKFDVLPTITCKVREIW